jgi:hypothetical protein
MQLEIDERKLSEYCLNPSHPPGKHKARVFSASLSMGPNEALLLKSLILDGAQEAQWIKGIEDVYGQRYFCDVSCENNKLFAMVRCAWILLPNSNLAPLTTCYVKTP